MTIEFLLLHVYGVKCL